MKKKSHDRSPDKRGFSIALPISLIESLEKIAQEEHRSRNGQIEYFLAKSVERWKQENSFTINREDKTIDFGNIEMVGNIAAGGLMEGDTIPYTIQTDSPYPPGYYALRVSGHSMLPSIPDGSIIVVKPWTKPNTPPPGTIVVYADGRGVTLKKLEIKDGKYVLVSTNPEYTDIEPIEGGSITAEYVDTIQKGEQLTKKKKSK